MASMGDVTVSKPSFENLRLKDPPRLPMLYRPPSSVITDLTVPGLPTTSTRAAAIGGPGVPSGSRSRTVPLTMNEERVVTDGCTGDSARSQAGKAGDMTTTSAISSRPAAISVRVTLRVQATHKAPVTLSGRLAPTR